MVVGYEWVQRIISIALEMVLPALLGHWLDGRWGTEPWLVSCGAVLGFAVAMWHLINLAGTSRRGPGGRGPTGLSGRKE
jgi:hypothetical protein